MHFRWSFSENSRWIEPLTDFSKDSCQVFGLALNTTMYSYHHIYLFVHLNLICDLALSRLYTYIELYYAKSK